MTECWRSFPDPGLIKQADGSAYQWQNCAPSSWSTLIVSDQHGHRPDKGSPWYPSGASLRKASGDTSGGIMPSTLDATVQRVYGLDYVVRIATKAAVQSALDRGTPVVILVKYGAIDDTALSGSPGFRGNHSIPLLGTSRRPDGSIDWLSGDPLYDGRRSGIPKGPHWLHRSTLVKAAGDLVLDSSGQTVRQRYGTDFVYAVFGNHTYTPGAPAPTPAPLPGVVDSAPASADERANRMIRGAYGVTSTRVQRLQPGQPLFGSPAGPRVSKIMGDKAVSLTYLGKVGNDWGMVIAMSSVPYKDHVRRPTGLYVPLAAGAVSNR